jgi:hypothetical protein
MKELAALALALLVIAAPMLTFPGDDNSFQDESYKPWEREDTPSDSRVGKAREPESLRISGALCGKRGRRVNPSHEELQ